MNIVHLEIFTYNLILLYSLIVSDKIYTTQIFPDVVINPSLLIFTYSINQHIDSNWFVDRPLQILICLSWSQSLVEQEENIFNIKQFEFKQSVFNLLYYVTYTQLALG